MLYITQNNEIMLMEEALLKRRIEIELLLFLMKYKRKLEQKFSLIRYF